MIVDLTCTLCSLPLVVILGGTDVSGSFGGFLRPPPEESEIFKRREKERASEKRREN